MGKNQSRDVSNKPQAKETVKRNRDNLFQLSRVPRFEPAKELITSFITRFEDTAFIFEIEDVKVMKSVFCARLPVETYRHYHYLPDLLKTNDDWDGFCSAIIESIHPRTNRVRHQDMLKKVTQGNRSVTEFKKEIDYLAERAFIHREESQKRDLEAKIAFLRGINPELKNEVQRMRFDHLSEIFAYALTIDEKEDSCATLIAAVTVAETCYFSIERKQSEETHPREPQSNVSTTCGSIGLISMLELEKNRIPQFGTINELELVLARGAGLFVDASPEYAKTNFSGQFICEQHLQELSTKWESKEFQQHIRNKYNKTSKRMERSCGIEMHDRAIPQGRAQFLSKEQAKKYLHHNHRLYHVGLPICSQHSNDINELPAVEVSEKSPKREEQMDVDYDLSNPELHAVHSEELKKAYDNFVKIANVKGAGRTDDFSAILPDSKKKKVYALKKVVKTMVDLVAPNHEKELMRMYLESMIPRCWTDYSDTKFGQCLEMVAEQYEKADNKRCKEIILSTIVKRIGLPELQKYIPGLSARKYRNAKLRAKQYAPIKEPVFKKTRYQPIRLNYFVTFITSPIVSTGLPYGERKVKTSDGSSLSIPNTIRLHRNAEIIRMYKKHMDDIGKKDLILSDTVAYAVLKKCSATRRHALTCVDYFMADGADAFEDIEDILNTLEGSALLDSDMAKMLKFNVAQSRLYLKTDFRMHLKMESKVIDHCYLHSLSDTTDSNFKYNGQSHSHSIRCPRCVMMQTTFMEINNVIANLLETMDKTHPSKKTVTEMRIRMEQNIERIQEMKKHLVRAGYTDLERTRLISELKDGEAFVTMDYAQKFLALYKWESQRKYFGKRGMPWHIFHVIAKVNGAYVQHSIVHVLRTNKQDKHSVVQMLDHILEQLREVNITGVHLRADNAGAYHSLGTIASIPHLVAKRGVKVMSFSFSEAQNGKSSCDRVAAQVKRRLRDYVDRGNNIKNEKDLFDGIAACGLSGLSVYLVSVKREKNEAAEKALSKVLHPKMDGISGYGHFEFDGNSVRVWKMNGIGKGRLFKDLSGFQRELSREDYGGYVASKESAKIDEELMKKAQSPQKFWTAYLTKNGKTDEEPDDADEVCPDGQESYGEIEIGVFTCNECSATFLKYGNLLRHLDIGRHKIRPEKIHLFDYALQLFKQKLEDVQAHNDILSEVSEAMSELINEEDQSSDEGWALRGKRKHVTLNEKAKKFAQRLFEAGNKSGRKMDPAEVERLMKEDDKIKPCERMNAQQIRSYFGTLCRAKKGTKKNSDKETEEEEKNHWEDLSDDEEEFIDDFGREMDDVIHDIIEENINDLFEKPDEPLWN